MKPEDIIGPGHACRHGNHGFCLQCSYEMNRLPMTPARPEPIFPPDLQRVINEQPLKDEVRRLVDKHGGSAVIRAVLDLVKQRADKAQADADAARKALEEAQAAASGTSQPKEH